MQNIFFKDKNIPYIEARYTLNSNKEYKEHFHTTLSIGAIVEGVASFRSNKEHLTLHQNMLVALNPFVLHSCNPIKSKFRSYYMLYIDTNWAYNLQKNIFTNIDSFIPISKSLIDNQNDYNKFIQLNRVLLDKDILYLQKQESLENFFSYFFKKYCNANRNFYESNNPNKNILKIKKAKAYIEQNYNKNLTIEEIAKSVDISPFYFSRIFKNYTNISLHQYLLNIRVEKAKELLKNSSTPLAILAQELGFNDQSHFNRVFKALTTCTPYEYRKY